MVKKSAGTHALILEFLLKTALLAASFGGVYLQAVIDGGFFKPKIYLYFTILSNTGIAVITLLLLPLRTAELLLDQPSVPQWLYTLKYMFTAALFTTLLVAFAILAPAIRNLSYILSPKNVLAHLLTPLLAAADFLVFDHGYARTKYSVPQSLILPGLYAALTLIFSIDGVYYTNGTYYPYFFFDYRTLGWFTLSPHKLGTAWWLGFIALLTAISSWLLLKLKKRISS